MIRNLAAMRSDDVARQTRQNTAVPERERLGVQWFRNLNAEGWRECCECEGGDSECGGARKGQRSKERGNYAKQEQAERVLGFEQENARAGDDEDDHESAVRSEVTEIIEVIVALPEGVEDQEKGEQEHEASEDALFPRRKRGRGVTFWAHPLHR
jgi:hypothetical protein